MIDSDRIIEEFHKHGGVLKTSELNQIGLSSRQLKKLLKQGEILKIKKGYYELSNEIIPDEIIIARLFPAAVICCERVLKLL